jgi:hypothetical protein
MIAKGFFLLSKPDLDFIRGFSVFLKEAGRAGPSGDVFYGS